MNVQPLSLRTKIILSFLVVIIVGGSLSLFFGSRLVKRTIISQAQAKVRHDLGAAWMVFNEKLNDVKEIVDSTASRESIQDAIKYDRKDILFRYLSRVRNENSLDILTLTDSKGNVILRTRNPQVIGDSQAQDEIIRMSLMGGICSFPQIVNRSELIKEAQELADRAYMEFVETPKAAQRPEEKEENGMMLKAASAVVDENGGILGVLYGGILINRNYEIVDRVKEIVYKDEQYKGREIGTATIFQHDLRISTNVKDEVGERAIGTRVSKEVNQAVLVEGKPWIDRAFVVNDWYITAYEPIKNISGDIIGILYVGVLERPYIDITNRVILAFSVIAVLSVMLLLVLLFISTTRIIHPIKEMVLATQKIAEGDLSHKVNVESKDEIGFLANSFNKMTADLKTANEKLLEWGRTLEKKVEERTKELREAQAHLIQSEKLASLGKLAAGVAHEINNPLGGILIYSHLLLEDLEESSPYYGNLEKIVKETTRCKDIVKGLLEFARPKEPEATSTNVNELLDKSLSLVGSQSLFQNIQVKKHYSTDLPLIVADSSQLQQVFMNIILNAADAMNGNGRLTLRTYLDSSGKDLIIDFEDTGPGIREEDKKKIFDPFFTTKEVGQGTGLGLSISYSIIRKHQGTIDVQSTFGEGATFTIKLPIAGGIEDD
ncbi:MAG TPA: cache domain-containing protein [Candidatus Heimdallarchaeota archaeon]|nr:cache domain-containing protein [Candidatus Heimdallarchaeota archaeon]